MFISLCGLLSGLLLFCLGYVLLPWSGGGVPALFSLFWMAAVILSCTGFARKYRMKKQLKDLQRNWRKARNKSRAPLAGEKRVAGRG